MGGVAHYGLGLSFAKCVRLLARLGIDVTAGARPVLGRPVHQHRSGAGPRRDREAGQRRRMVVMDETGWRVGGHGAWVWVTTTQDATAYDVADGRGFEQACDRSTPTATG
jgi:transposase